MGTRSKRFSAANVTLTALLLLSGSLLAGCGESTSNAQNPSGHHMSAAEQTAKLRKMLAREMPVAPMNDVALLDSLASAQIESDGAPKIECKKNGGETACSIVAMLGQDEDGTQASVACIISTDFDPFGLVVKRALGASRLDEAPELATTPVGEGISVSFVANALTQDTANVYFGTAKINALYAHGYMAACVDGQAGGKKTFERVTQHFYESLKFKVNPKKPTVFAFGYQNRTGDRTTGFRYDAISQRQTDEGGFVEARTFFWLQSDGKSWSVHDGAAVIERDAKGSIEKMQNLIWVDGKGPAVLSAKPSEEKRFRLKFEVGDKSNGLESTPKAPLSTELWSAPELAKVATGAAPSYKYAFLDLIDSDPEFHYLTITRSAPGVLLEDQEAISASGKKEKTTDAAEREELHVDARGLVTKQVSSHSVAELVYTWGDLPSLLAVKADKPGKAKK